MKSILDWKEFEKYQGLENYQGLKRNWKSIKGWQEFEKHQGLTRIWKAERGLFCTCLREVVKKNNGYFTLRLIVWVDPPPYGQVFCDFFLGVHLTSVYDSTWVETNFDRKISVFLTISLSIIMDILLFIKPSGLGIQRFWT